MFETPSSSDFWQEGCADGLRFFVKNLFRTDFSFQWSVVEIGTRRGAFERAPCCDPRNDSWVLRYGIGDDARAHKVLPRIAPTQTWGLRLCWTMSQSPRGRLLHVSSPDRLTAVLDCLSTTAVWVVCTNGCGHIKRCTEAFLKFSRRMLA